MNRLWILRTACVWSIPTVVAAVLFTIATNGAPS